MPRAPRSFVAGCIYHIAARGSDRRTLFVLDSDRAAFLDRLAAVAERYELACIAYCLMGNHYHLVVKIPDERISRALQVLNGGYARHFNRAHGRTAHLFRHRPAARLVDSDTYLLTVCSYLAHNPVRAGFCEDPGDWPWGSHRATAGLDVTPRMLNDDSVRDALSETGDWRARYRDFVERAADAAP